MEAFGRADTLQVAPGEAFALLGGGARLLDVGEPVGSCCTMLKIQTLSSSDGRSSHASP